MSWQRELATRLKMLGHADLASTQIYTRVSLRKLGAVHAATHPGAANEPGSAGGDSEEDEEQPE